MPRPIIVKSGAPRFRALARTLDKGYVMGNVKLTFEKLYTVMTQIESCLNSHLLVPLLHDQDGIAVLTPGHFFIGSPLEPLPDPGVSALLLVLVPVSSETFLALMFF